MAIACSFFLDFSVFFPFSIFFLDCSINLFYILKHGNPKWASYLLTENSTKNHLNDHFSYSTALASRVACQHKLDLSQNHCFPGGTHSPEKYGLELLSLNQVSLAVLKARIALMIF